MAQKNLSIRGKSEEHGEEQRDLFSGFSSIKFLLIITCLVVVIPILFDFYAGKSETYEKSIQGNSRDKAKCWISNKHNTKSFLMSRTYETVFDRFGFDFVNGSNDDNWDVLWSSEYPFSTENPSVNSRVKVLKPHQRVNHFPGMNYVTLKSFMTSRNRDVKAILPGFMLPTQAQKFKTYITENPNARFVRKHEHNRGIMLVNVSDINLEQTGYYQLFMEKPLLVDERAMDLSSYFVISSIDPIRIYRYTQEIHIRFCEEPYYPFDPLNLNKYVISDTRKLAFQMPSLQVYDNTFGFSHKASIEAHLTEQGFNVTQMWNKIDDTVVQLLVNNEINFLAETFKLYNSSHHFFEMLRVDFLLDENLEPHLSEANMSPGMTPKQPMSIKKLTATYEKVVYDTLNLVGVSDNLSLKSRYDPSADEMLANSKNIAVYALTCLRSNCSENCGLKLCQLCTSCVSEINTRNMKQAYREHTRRGDFKRIFPSERNFNDDFVSKMTPKNQISVEWFKAKCHENRDWC